MSGELHFFSHLGVSVAAAAEAVAAAPGVHGDLLGNIGLSVCAAAVIAFIASKLKQPPILAYLVAGVLIGPEIGLRLIADQEVIESISEIGLILLLFIIGLEMDLKKLRASGKPVIVTGSLQFVLCTLLGLAFFPLLGFRVGQPDAVGGQFGLLYMAVTAALSSTMIVVKLLYDKFELDTLPGRITLGVLVFQDVWAIIVLAIQPNLLNPQFTPLLAAFTKGVLLVTVSLLASRYLLPSLFRSIAKLPELMLVASLAWCFLVCAGANSAGLSREMGALVAGVALSTFPYRLDITAKVTNIRDFFVTLFFVALGMKIPLPTSEILTLAIFSSLFLVASRFLSVFPVLYLMGYGHRVALLPSLNLSQISEFSLVIASLGLAAGHIDTQLVSLVIFIFAITSTLSTYIINASHSLYQSGSRLLSRLGVRDLADEQSHQEPPVDRAHRRVVFLGFFRDASSILHEFDLAHEGDGRHPLLDEVLVIDFNPVVYNELQRRGIDCVYGDISARETLHHAGIHGAELVVATIPDATLKGTTNAQLLRQVRQLYPQASIIVSAESVSEALRLYEQGADYVYMPRLHSAVQMARVMETSLIEGLTGLREEQKDLLRKRKEVLP
ncbi:MAG: cation:proton antiporter [Candidatus Binatia bacterium]